MMKAKVDVASIKKSTSYSSAHRRGNLLEVHILDAKNHSSGLEVIFDSSLNALLMYHLLLDPRKLAERRKQNLLSQQAGEGTTKEWWRTQFAFCFHVESWRPWKEFIQFLHGAETNCSKLLSMRNLLNMSFWGSKGDPLRDLQQVSCWNKTKQNWTALYTNDKRSIIFSTLNQELGCKISLRLQQKKIKRGTRRQDKPLQICTIQNLQIYCTKYSSKSMREQIKQTNSQLFIIILCKSLLANQTLINCTVYIISKYIQNTQKKSNKYKSYTCQVQYAAIETELLCWSLTIIFPSKFCPPLWEQLS